MASTSETSVELKKLLPTAIPERDDTGRNSETQLTTACVQQKPTPSSQTTSKEREPKPPEPSKSRAFYKKTYSSGKIRFIKDKTHIGDAKFIKINSDAGDDESIMQQVAEGVVTKLWRHRHTNLLLSVASGADKLDKKGRKAFKEGIEKMLPGTCLLTGGTNDEVTRLVGEAVHEFNMSKKELFDQCPSIGIVCLDRLQNKDTIKHYELTRGVIGIDSDGELFTVNKRGERWTLNPASLTEVYVQSDGNTTTSALTRDVYGNSSSPRFAVGDLVLISNDPESVLSAMRGRGKDFLESIIGKIGSIVQVNDYNQLSIQVNGEQYSCWYKPEAVELLTGERFIDLLKTPFETYEPSDENDELVQAVKNGDVKNVYAILRKAYTDFIGFTSGSFGVDYSGNFFVVDANGDRRTFIQDDLTKYGMTNAIEGKAVDTPNDFAPGNLVMILSTAWNSIFFTNRMKPTIGKVGTIVTVNDDYLDIRVCGQIYPYSPDCVTLVERGLFDMLKEHLKTHEPAYESDELQQAVNEDNFEKVTAIIRKVYKDGQRVCEYELTTTIDDSEDKANTERYLNPHHHLFVLVEDSTLNKFGGEIEFRTILEKQISFEMIRSRMKGEIYQDRSVLQVPLVNLVLNNVQYTLAAFKSALDKGIPFVVVTTTDSDAHKRQDSAISDSKNEIQTKTYHHLAVITLSNMSKMLEEMTLDVCWKASSVGVCLLKWALCDRKKDDVLKRLVCTDGRRMNSDAIAFTMNYFLIGNDVECVGALFQLDVNMNSAWIEAHQYMQLCNVRHGLLKRLKSKAKHTVLWVMQRVQARPVRGKFEGHEAWLPATCSSEKQLHAEDLLPYWDYMFIWTLLLRKHDMAKILWEVKGKHPLFMALIARNLCKAVKKQTDDKVLIVEMENNMSEWSTVAIDFLNECYQNSDDATYVHLTMAMPFWNKKSCLDLAVESRNKEFLAQQACRNLVGDVWNGQRMNDKLNNLRDSYPDTGIKFFLNKMQAPKTKFAYNVISYLVFLSLFAYVLLFDLTKTVSTKEFVLMSWVMTILVEEIRQMHQIYQVPEKAISCVQRIRKLKNYFSEGWNCIDMFTIVMFLLGFGLRFKQSRDTYDWPRVVLAVDFVAFVFRLVHIFSVQKTLGPKLIIIIRMVQDLLYFLVIMTVFVLAYAIASHSILYPDAPVTWETAGQIIRKPYLNLYGELFLDEIEEDSTDCTHDASLWTNGTSPRCPSETGKIVVPIMMGVYLLFSNILLLNLLIAMFSYTFTTIHEQSDKIWCFQRYFIIKDYALRPILCPPLNVFWHIYQLFQCCLHKCESSQESDYPFHIPYEDTDTEYNIHYRYMTLSSFMQSAVRKYAKNRKRNEAESIDSRIETANEKLDQLAEREEKFRNQALECFEALNKKVDDLETKVIHEEEFRNTMITRTLQAAEREDEFRRLVLAQLYKMQECIDNLQMKKADMEDKAEEKNEAVM